MNELKEYMVDFVLPEVMSPEFVSLIPSQRSKINKMMSAGKITSYSLSLNRRKLWASFTAPDENSVIDMLAEWPLIRFMDFEIHELFFRETVSERLPVISLN